MGRELGHESGAEGRDQMPWDGLEGCIRDGVSRETEIYIIRNIYKTYKYIYMDL